MQTSQVSEASQPFVAIACDLSSPKDPAPQGPSPQEPSQEAPSLPLDQEAKEKLFEQIRAENAARLRRIVYSFAGPNDREDLEQEILLGLWESLDSYRGDASPGTWFYRVACNRVGKFVRRSRRWEQERSTAGRTAPEGKGVIGNLELETVLEAFLRTVGETDRKLLRMCADDTPYEEIAAKLGGNPDHVRMKVYRLRRRLEAFIGL